MVTNPINPWLNQEGHMSDIIIRKAVESDLSQLTDIYNYEVLNGTATFDINPQSIEVRRGWYDAHQTDNHPLFVAEKDGQVAGYVTLSEYRVKEAYKKTVELSIYIGSEFRNQGIATQLMDFIISYARKNPQIHAIVSVITDGNLQSNHLHEKFGFTFCGLIPDLGQKFGKYIGIRNYLLLV